MGRREQAREQTRERILAAARAEIAEHGGVGLSMRAVARESGLVSSAVYRYFPTREDLLTAMILESYGNLASSLQAVGAEGSQAPSAALWRRLAETFRGWARAYPHEFQLIYGTPIPGYVAPPETAPAAAAVASPFLALGGAGVAPRAGTALREQLSGPAAGLGTDADWLAAVLAELATLVGFVGLELAGHFVGTADPADQLWAAVLDRQVATLALPSP